MHALAPPLLLADAQTYGKQVSRSHDTHIEKALLATVRQTPAEVATGTPPRLFVPWETGKATLVVSGCPSNSHRAKFLPPDPDSAQLPTDT